MTEPDSGLSSTSHRPRPWWERWPGRLEAELERFSHHGLPCKLVEDPRAHGKRLVIEIVLDLPGHEATRLTVVYPDAFPNRRFAIYAPALRLPRHQAFGGSLCVFPREAQHWHPGFMAADIVIHRVPRLVELVEEGGERLRAEEDPQGEPLTTFYHSPLQGGVIVDDRVLSADLEPAGAGSMTLMFTDANAAWLEDPPDPAPAGWLPGVGQALLTQVRDTRSTPLLPDPIPALAARFPVAKEGRWVFLANPPYAESPEELWAAAMAADSGLATWARVHTGQILLGICTREEVAQRKYAPAWVFLTRRVINQPQKRKGKGGRQSGNPANRGPRRVESPAMIVQALRWSDEGLSMRIPQLEPMRRACVTIVGLGSLGAPFVQEMAKARIGSLRLADFDHIDPGTLVRYPLGLDHAGMDKGFALARWVQMHNPEIELQLSGIQIGSTPIEPDMVSEDERLHAIIGGADLLVSATAENDVNRQLDQLALDEGVSRLYLWSQSGYGGIVALLQPGKTGCFHCLEAILSERAQAGHPLVDVPPDDDRGLPAGTVQGIGCADKTFTAPHADLLPISIHAARVAYGYLSAAGDDGYPRMKGDVFAVQIREADGTPIPPRWTTYELPARPTCPICSAS